jgi:hypothetical protein
MLTGAWMVPHLSRALQRLRGVSLTNPTSTGILLAPEEPWNDFEPIPGRHDWWNRPLGMGRVQRGCLFSHLFGPHCGNSGKLFPEQRGMDRETEIDKLEYLSWGSLPKLDPASICEAFATATNTVQMPTVTPEKDNIEASSLGLGGSGCWRMLENRYRRTSKNSRSLAGHRGLPWLPTARILG